MHFYALLCLITLSPLPFGSNRPWSWSLLSLLVALLTLSWCISYLLKEKKMKLHFSRIKIPFILFTSTLLWAFFQSSTFIPQSWGHPLWQMTAETLQIEIPTRISLSPEQTISASMRLLAYGLVFILSMYYCQKSENAKKLFNWLAIAGFTYAIYGLVIYLGDFNKILWFDKIYYQQDVTSTIINRNSYATYAGLSLLCLVPNILHEFKNSAAYGLNSNYGKQLFIENLITRAWKPVLMFFTVGTALFLTHSRGGFLSTTLAIITLFSLLSISKKLQSRSLNYAVLSVAVMAFALFTVSGDKVMERMGDISVEKAERPKVYSATLTGIADNPYLGFGYGSYQNAFRLYRTADINGNYDKAHNTYLENLFELGIPAASALFLSILIISLQCLKGIWNRQRHWIYPTIAFSSTVLVSAHSFVDFSLQIPAIAVTYAAILGAGFAQSYSSKSKQS